MYMCGGEKYKYTPKEAHLGQLDQTIVFYGQNGAKSGCVCAQCAMVMALVSLDDRCPFSGTSFVKKGLNLG